MKLGYTSKAKGIAQVLWERGLWVNKMKLKLPTYHKDYPYLSVLHVLVNCTEKSNFTNILSKEKLFTK